MLERLVPVLVLLADAEQRRGGAAAGLDLAPPVAAATGALAAAEGQRARCGARGAPALVGAPALADAGAVGVEGALAEAEGALLVAELVGGDAQLGVLEADVEARVGHLVHVDGVVGGELGEGVEEVVDARGGEGLRGGVERARVRDGRHGAVGAAAVAREAEGDHGDGPAAQAHGGDGLALGVEVAHELRADVPVAAEVEVLHGVHGQVLQVVQAEVGGEEVQADEGPLEVEEVGGPALARRREGVLEEAAEAARRVEPLDEEGEHGGRLARQPERDAAGAAVAAVVEALAEKGRRRAEQAPVDDKLLLPLADEDGRGIIVAGATAGGGGGGSGGSSRPGLALVVVLLMMMIRLAGAAAVCRRPHRRLCRRQCRPRRKRLVEAGPAERRRPADLVEGRGMPRSGDHDCFLYLFGTSFSSSSDAVVPRLSLPNNPRI